MKGIQLPRQKLSTMIGIKTEYGRCIFYLSIRIMQHGTAEKQKKKSLNSIAEAYPNRLFEQEVMEIHRVTIGILE